MTPELHVIGIDPGGTTGWTRLTVPRAALYGADTPTILEWDFGEFAGDEVQQVYNIATLAREVQSLSYRIGPALVVEDWTVDPSFRSADPATLSPVRIAFGLRVAAEKKFCGDACIVLQNRALAKSTATDDRLRKWGLYTTGSDHIRDATRHALTALRRARANPDFRDKCWVNY